MSLYFLKNTSKTYNSHELGKSKRAFETIKLHAVLENKDLNKNITSNGVEDATIQKKNQNVLSHSNKLLSRSKSKSKNKESIKMPLDLDKKATTLEVKDDQNAATRPAGTQATEVPKASASGQPAKFENTNSAHTLEQNPVKEGSGGKSLPTSRIGSICPQLRLSKSFFPKDRLQKTFHIVLKIEGSSANITQFEPKSHESLSYLDFKIKNLLSGCLQNMDVNDLMRRLSILTNITKQNSSEGSPKATIQNFDFFIQFDFEPN